MESQFKKLKIKVERFEAILPTPESLSNSDGLYFDIYKNHKKTRLRNIDQLLGEFGCFISHYEIHKIAEKNNYENYLILEDDCHLQKKTIPLSNYWKNHNSIKNWDLIRCCRKSSEIPRLVNDFGTYDFNKEKWYGNPYAQGSHFTLFNSKSNKKLLKLFSEKTYAVDNMYTDSSLLSYNVNLGTFINGNFESDIIKEYEV